MISRFNTFLVQLDNEPIISSKTSVCTFCELEKNSILDYAIIFLHHEVDLKSTLNNRFGDLFFAMQQRARAAQGRERIFRENKLFVCDFGTVLKVREREEEFESARELCCKQEAAIFVPGGPKFCCAHSSTGCPNIFHGRENARDQDVLKPRK